MNKGKVIAVNVSDKKGIVKTPVSEIEINESGIIDDAHSGNWHRQISLLDMHSIIRFQKELGREINHGEFAENITTDGFILYKMNLMDRFKINDVELELTQIGKECHGGGCAIYNAVGKCVMPKEGIFCRVISGGKIKPGDEIIYLPKIYNVLIITLSDRANRGEYSDRSGPAAELKVSEWFEKKNIQHKIEKIIIPDDSKKLAEIVEQYSTNNFDLIITTGGTGIGDRDITVETIQPMLNKEIPGIMEMIRVKYGAEKPNALLSRGIAGTIGKTLIYTLPGSVKAVNEYLTEIENTFFHLVYMLNNLDTH
jgi:molybdopterin adenylyltransferase